MNHSQGTLNSAVSYNANNQISSGGYTYDAAGNVNAVNNGISNKPYPFDAESKIYSTSAGAYFTYDATGERMRKDFGGAFTEYQRLGGQPIAEKNTDGSWSDYIHANGQLIARADSFDARIHTHGTCSYM